MARRLQSLLDSLGDDDRRWVELTRLVPLKVAAASLAMTPVALRQRIARGTVRSHHLDGRIYLTDGEVERLMDRTANETRRRSAKVGSRPEPADSAVAVVSASGVP